jgi:hypothetical protein
MPLPELVTDNPMLLHEVADLMEIHPGDRSDE